MAATAPIALIVAAHDIVEHSAFDPEYLSDDLNEKLTSLRHALESAREPVNADAPMLNLSAWMERRRPFLGPNGDYLIKQVQEYEAYIATLTAKPTYEQGWRPMTLHRVECGHCGWQGRRKAGDTVTCPECGEIAAFQEGE